MHISEGILSAPVLITGAALAVAGTAMGLKKLKEEKIPHAALLASVFFTVSLIRVPIGPANLHLVLNGVMGLLLGWIAFPTILVALALQALIFQYGGLTTLGVNTVIMALPAVAMYYLFGKAALSDKNAVSMAAGFSVGFGSILLSAIFMALALVITGKSFTALALMILAAYLPLMFVEGILVLFCVRFLKKVKPEVLGDTIT